MRKPQKKWDLSLFILAGFLLLTNGCATLALNRGRDEFYRGKLEEAETRLETVRRARGRNKLLLLMERGLIYQAKEKYKKSNRDLLESAQEAEKLEIISVHKQAGSFLSSDLLLSYRGEPFEKVLIHTYSAINFLKLKKWEDALVECKRALKKLSHSPFPDDQLFTNYLAGICYEIMGEYDDARIEYEKVKEVRPDIPFLEHDLKRISGSGKISHGGELICFIQIGKSPVKRSVESFIPPDKRFVIPEYCRRKYLCRKAVVLVTHTFQQKEKAETSESYLLTNIETLAEKTLSERMEKEIAREAARLAVKEKASKKIEEESSEITGNLIRIGFMLLESADTRSWQTLPARLEAARLFLNPGTCDVNIQFFGADNAMVEETHFEKVEIKPGEKVFLLSRSLQ